MLKNETIQKLQELRLGIMAERFREMQDNADYQALSFEDKVGLMVDAQWNYRKSNQLHRLIATAGYAIPSACIEDIDYLPARKLDRGQIMRLASCNYVQAANNVVLLGATGAGKSYIACALGVAANREFYATRYIRLPDLLVELAVARGDGTYREYMKKLKKVKLLILDEWLLYPLKEGEARDVLELVEARSKVASTIFCSQFDLAGWHAHLYDPTLADAICDRIVHNSYVIQVDGDSMRRRKGLPE